jgi:indolepyruvate ferredoxin oxidoreductase beta subunit
MEGDRRRITIAILALGGQGGGVLADWILDAARRAGYIAQGTSVPGVAQRTGTTVYYIELIPATPGDNRAGPVLALNPVPGDVDIVIASELMEAGRAILRGFVTKDRTTLIGSTHRIYAIAEKSAPGDGRDSAERILAAAERRARRFIGFDMDRTAGEAGSVISSVMLGALAGSDALPIGREIFEEAIRAGGKAVAANMKGFGAGIAAAEGVVTATPAESMPPAPTSAAGRALAARIAERLPEPARAFAIEGVRKLMDYQDAAYATLYLDRLESVRALDGGSDDWALTRETARSLALWMAYDDVIRVADLKVRASRSARVADEVRVRPDQVLRVTEYMHPRLKEVCETLPAGIGRAILRSDRLRTMLEPLFAKGRHVETTGVRWFLALRLVAGMRRFRLGTLRYAEENARIEAWLGDIHAVAADPALAAEIARNQRLIKGYGETFDRGLANFVKVTAVARSIAGQPRAADRVRGLRDAALADETGCMLDTALAAAG